MTTKRRDGKKRCRKDELVVVGNSRSLSSVTLSEGPLG
jgi:hypothetical protein